jgi:signal transduction histidine kinase
MLLMRDITEIRKLESARAQFLNNVSHELKTPLTIIKGFVITLIKSPDIPEDYRRYLEFIDRETDRLTRLVEDLLQIARFRSGREILKLNFCEPREILQHMHTQMAPKAREHRIYLGLDVPDSLPIVLADGDRIKEVLTNLVDNAIKYSPPHSRVDVSGRATEEELIIKVCDNGPGVPAGELPFLFERFFRGDEKRKRASGTGLGLAIVKEIVEAHGGRIKAESEEGKGTTFTVNLPLRKGKKAPAPAAPEESDSEEPQDEEVNGAEVPAEEARTE